jgi:hypothetical protein
MRLPDWAERLQTVISEAKKKKFEYGSFDCALFAASCVEAVTGIDYAAELRGYDSKVAACRIIAEFGSLETMITSILGKEPVHPAVAGRLAVVIGEAELELGEEGECIGFLIDAVCWFPTRKGIVKKSRAIARRAWSID